MTVIDLFAGAGGWDIAARDLGFDPLGVEYDHAACATRRAAGLPTIEADLLSLSPHDFDPIEGLIASPPCQTFSTAGKGAGRKALDEVLGHIDTVAAGRPITDADHLDPRTLLVLEPLRWALELEPEWIALEQVPPVMPIWQAYGRVLAEDGYHVVTGLLQAEQYGVPQTRKRAILLAARHPVAMPTPTHSRYHPRDPQRLDDGVQPWVSMAEALGWGMTARPSTTVVTGNNGAGPDPMSSGSGGRQVFARERSAGRWAMRSNYGTGGDASNRGEREIDEPSPTVTSHIDRNLWTLRNGNQAKAAERNLDQPAGTLFFGNRLNDVSWVHDRPATTVQGDPRVGRPGHKDRSNGGESQFAENAVRVTEAEASVLQSFPADYPWQGTKTAQFRQIGNAIPPLLARAVLQQLIG